MYFMYVRFVFMHTRRGNQIPLYMVLRHHGISENWTQDLRIVKCSQTPSHLFSPSLLKLYKVPETRIKCLTLGTNSYLQWRTIFKVLLLEGSSKSLPLLIHWSFRCWSLTLPNPIFFFFRSRNLFDNCGLNVVSMLRCLRPPHASRGEQGVLCCVSDSECLTLCPPPTCRSVVRYGFHLWFFQWMGGFHRGRFWFIEVTISMTTYLFKFTGHYF